MQWFDHIGEREIKLSGNEELTIKSNFSTTKFLKNKEIKLNIFFILAKIKSSQSVGKSAGVV